MTCKRERFKIAHSDGFPSRPIFLEGALEFLETIAQRKDSFIETIMVDNEPAAIIGLIVQWRGCATVWSITSDRVGKAKKNFHKHTLEAIKDYSRILSLHRLQMNVRADYPKGIEWAESLGFVNEGKMLKFDPEGKDYFRFAKVING